MADIPATNVRRFWFTLHRWIGASLAALLIPISLSGALLVWHEQIEALLNPQRYAVTGSQILPPSAYLESAARSLGRRRHADHRSPSLENGPGDRCGARPRRRGPASPD